MAVDGRIFFVDPGAGTIYQTNLNGEALPTIGKKGEGPEEFNWPRNIFYDAPYLSVYDGAKEKLFRLDGFSGVFLKSWRLPNIGVYSIKGNQFSATFRRPESGHILGLGKLGEKGVTYDHFVGNTPCCLRVSGSKKSAVLTTSHGQVWMAHTGTLQLQHFNQEGLLLKSMEDELPHYVPPNKASKISRFDIKGRSARAAIFDKIDSLYEVGNHIVLYRYKMLSDSYFDVFTKDGKRISSQKADEISPVGVKDKMLYGFLRGNETTPWDIMLVKLDFPN